MQTLFRHGLKLSHNSGSLLHVDLDPHLPVTDLTVKVGSTDLLGPTGVLQLIHKSNTLFQMN